jgi:acyl carrier protein phosphodiesterase
LNYLAHAYLSFNQPAILVGNLISDFVKGKKQFDFPAPVHKGILLHRAIDAFTDVHPATHAAKTVFSEAYRLYSAVFTDVAYDHFLANDEQQFPGDSLYAFSQEVYSMLDEYIPVFPEKFRRMYPYMKQQNWLYNYRHHDGIEKSFEGLAYRATYITESQTAFTLFNNHYTTLQECYNAFFPAVKEFALATLNDLNAAKH